MWFNQPAKGARSFRVMEDWRSIVAIASNQAMSLLLGKLMVRLRVLTSQPSRSFDSSNIALARNFFSEMMAFRVSISKEIEWTCNTIDCKCNGFCCALEIITNVRDFKHAIVNVEVTFSPI